MTDDGETFAGWSTHFDGEPVLASPKLGGDTGEARHGVSSQQGHKPWEKKLLEGTKHDCCLGGWLSKRVWDDEQGCQKSVLLFSDCRVRSNRTMMKEGLFGRKQTLADAKVQRAEHRIGKERKRKVLIHCAMCLKHTGKSVKFYGRK